MSLKSTETNVWSKSQTNLLIFVLLFMDECWPQVLSLSYGGWAFVAVSKIQMSFLRVHSRPGHVSWDSLPKAWDSLRVPGWDQLFDS